MNLKNNLFFLTFFLASYFFVAQDFSDNNRLLKFKEYSLTEGLSQSSVLCILQDSNGYMWFGTRDGLNKYNGHTFKTYRYNLKDKNSISSSYIKFLFEDKKGNIWIGTNNGLNKYIPHEDNFKRFKHSKDTKSLIDDEIWSIANAKEDYLWIGTNRGLEKFNTITGKGDYIQNTSKNATE